MKWPTLPTYATGILFYATSTTDAGLPLALLVMVEAQTINVSLGTVGWDTRSKAVNRCSEMFSVKEAIAQLAVKGLHRLVRPTRGVGGSKCITL